MTHKYNGKPIHQGRLAPSTPDAVALALAVEERFLRLCALWLRSRGGRLPVPESLSRDLYRWRTMTSRHKTGDLRNTEAEYRSTKAVAEWTVAVNCELCGQPAKKIQWPD